MAKAINWPREFRDEILAEDCEQERCAFRLGDLYYLNRYWVPDEVVDIRVNHLKVRKATITRDLRQCPIRALTAEDFACQKSALSTPEAVTEFLAKTYNQPVTPDTPVTVVYYKNHPIDPDELEQPDDPHL